MKKMGLALICALILTVFSSCADGSLADDQLLSVRNRNNGKVISIGDTRDYVNKVTGGDEADGGTFDDGVERAYYWDTPGIGVDFLDGKVVAIMLQDDSRWETVEKVHVGMSESKVKELYASDKYAEQGLSGGILLGYDDELNPITFSQDAPYYRVISFEDGKVSMIIIQDNF